MAKPDEVVVVVEPEEGGVKDDGSGLEESSEGTTGNAPLLTGEELLHKRYPRYHYDENEKYFPKDLNQYCADQSAIPGCNAVATPSKDGEHTWLIYMCYFQEDGGLVVLGGTGGHKHDLEIVIVEVDNVHQRVTGIFYAPHSSHEHMWIRNREDVMKVFDKSGRPLVYVSNGKHAGYPVPGNVIRLFGFGTDSCTNPTEKELPLFILNEETKKVDRIDDEFLGPKHKIARDWSTAPLTRLKEVRSRRALPSAAQVGKEIAKLKFW